MRMACFILLNPSTADEVKNDPTVERCERRSRKMGYDGLYVANIFAFRATDPKVMKAEKDPVGPENDEYIINCAKQAGLIVCGWGAHGGHQGRSKKVFDLLKKNNIVAKCLGVTKLGEPRHPLYISYEVEPTDWI